MNRGVVYSLAALGLLWGATSSLAVEKAITLPPDNPLGELKAGPGVDVVRANCIACHSTDYIVRQPGGDAKRWEAEVKKMITVFGGPISESNAEIIVRYLSSAYGPAPAVRPAEKKQATTEPKKK